MGRPPALPQPGFLGSGLGSSQPTEHFILCLGAQSGQDVNIS